MLKDGLAPRMDRKAQLPVASVQDRQGRVRHVHRRHRALDRERRDVHGGDGQARKPDCPAQVPDGCQAGNRHPETLRVPACRLRYVIEGSLAERKGRGLAGLQARLLFHFRGRKVVRQGKAVHDDVGLIQADHGPSGARGGLTQSVPYRARARIARGVFRMQAKRKGAGSDGAPAQLDHLDRARADVQPQYCPCWPHSLHHRLVY